MMLDGTGHQAWEYAKAFGMMLVGIVGWNLRREIKRTDVIEANYVDKDTFNSAVNSLRTDFKSHADRVEKSVTRTHERVDKLLERKNNTG